MQKFIRSLLQRLIHPPDRPPAAVPIAVQRVQLELLLQKTGPVRILSPIPFATPLAVLFYSRWASSAALVWIGLFFLVVISSYVRRKKLEAHGPIHGQELGSVLQGRIQDLFLLGTMWGLAPWMLSAYQNAEGIILVSIFIMGAISLGSAIVSTHRQAIAAFSIPAAAGMITACIWFGGLVGYVLAVCMTIFLIMTLKWTYQQADLLAQSLTVRFEKEDLARRLEKQVELVEDANREKSRFLASASHDLRQPLHAISLFTSVLERSRLDPQSAQTVTRLCHSVRMLSQSLDTMLDISRLDAGAVQPRIEPLRVHDLFMSLHTTFAGRAQEKELQFRFRAPGDMVVLSDLQLLERLLGNLIDNAIKYTHGGGVLIAARAGPAARRERHVCFDIIDTGIGIDGEYHSLVFDEFYQLGNPQRDRAFGLGIGLSIVQRLADLLEHPISLESKPQRGTRFRVWVREGSKSFGGIDSIARPDILPALRIESKLPRHVLVIDDEPDSREALASLLSSYGCKVRTAGDVDQAEHLLRQHPIDAVVADFRLPGERSGLDFLLALRTASPHIRTLLVTGETAPHRITTIKTSGIPCLYKPVRAQHLLTALAD